MRDFDTSQISGKILRVFIAVYDEMSVSKAAKVLYSSQPTVSHNLEKLRAILGDPLFVQSGRGITATAKAEMLAPRVRRLLSEMEALRDIGDYHPELDPAPVIVAANGSCMPFALQKIRDRIWQDYPGKELIFRELNTRDNMESFLYNGGADIAVSSRRGQYERSLCSHYIFSNTARVYFDSSRRSPPDSLDSYCSARHAMMEYGSGPVKSAVQTALLEQGLTREVVLTAPNVWVLAQLIKGTSIIATLPSCLAEPAFDGLDSCELPLPLHRVQYDLVWHQRFNNSAKTSWLKSLLSGLFS